jgi:hypothetical protein
MCLDLENYREVLGFRISKLYNTLLHTEQFFLEKEMLDKKHRLICLFGLFGLFR